MTDAAEYASFFSGVDGFLARRLFDTGPVLFPPAVAIRPESVALPEPANVSSEQEKGDKP